MKTHLHLFRKTGIFLAFLLLIGFSHSTSAQDCDYTNYKNSGTGYYYLYPTIAWQTVPNTLVVANCQWYTVFAVAGKAYTFKTGCGDGASGDLGFDTYLTIYAWPDGNFLASDDDGCYNPTDPRKSIVSYISPVDQYLIIRVSGYNNASGGNYTMAYNEVQACNALASFSSSASGATINFSDESSGTPNSWSWNFGDGNTSTTQNPSNIYTCSGDYNVILTITESNGCTNTYSSVVTVTVPGGSVASSTHAVAGNTVTFTNSSSGTITNYAWDFGDGTSSTAASPVQTYTCAGYYTVHLRTTDNNGCTSDQYQVVQATGDPKAGYTITAVSGTTVNLTSTSTGTNLTYEYDFGDGTPIDTAANPTHTYTCPGGYYIGLRVASLGPCTSTTFYRYVEIVGNPTASFFSTTTGSTATFVNTTTGTITGYQWYFGDGGVSTAQDPTRTYACPGSYYVTLEATSSNGCVSNTAQSVTVTGDPAPEFSYSATGTTVNFSDLSTGTSLSYFWDFGDGTTSTAQNPSHTYTCGGNKYVYLRVTNLTGCEGYSSQVVPVVGDPNPIFISNVSGNTVTFSNATTGTVASQNWDFGDGTTSNAQAPTHIYNCPGTYNVTLEVTGTNGCWVTSTDEVVIAGSPAADFNYSGSGTTISFTDASTGSGLSYSWNFGDGSTSTDQNPSHSYTCGGSYSVTLNITNDTCSSYIERVVEVVGDPYASYTYDVQGTTVNFTNTSVGNITNTFWYFYNVDANTWSYSLLADPSPTLTDCGTYEVFMQVTNGNGCSHYNNSTISLPHTGIDQQSDSALTALANGATYQWVDCNNGFAPISGETNQSYNAGANGSYAVIVTAGSCTDTSACVSVISVGIEKDITEAEISIYPNPSHNRFVLQTNGTGRMQIKVADLVGRIVFTKEVTSNGGLTQVIDLSSESAGVYTLTMESSQGGKVSRKLVKE